MCDDGSLFGHNGALPDQCENIIANTETTDVDSASYGPAKWDYHDKTYFELCTLSSGM